jgi:pimeloyl-ACP methyl ester carboxylesterase
MMAEAIPNAHYVTIANTAHVPSFEKADAFAPIVAAHLERRS